MSNLVPEGWAETKVSDVCHTIYRYPTFYGMDTFESGVPVIRGEHIKGNGKLSDQWSDYYFVCSKFSSKYPKTQLLEGDVVMAVRGTVGKFAKVGKCHQMSQISPNLIRLAPERSVIEQDFFFHNLFPVKDSLLKDCVSATGVPALNGKDIAEARMLLPPLPEQKKIAAILTSVDDVIEKTQAQIDKLKDLKTGMMQELLTRGVGVDGKPHTEFKDSPVGSIPKGWAVENFGNVFTLKNGVNKGKEFFGKGVPIISYRNVYDGNGIYDEMLSNRVEMTQSELDRFKVEKGDLFITRTSETPDEIGFTNVYLGELNNVVYNGFVIRARQKADTFDFGYCKYAFQADYMRQQMVHASKFTTRAGISGESLERLKIVIPPKSEQKVIGEALSSIDVRIQALMKAKVHKLSLKKALMQDLLTGKVRVKVED